MGVENKFERSLRAAADELCVRHGRSNFNGEIVLRRLVNGAHSGWISDLPLRLASLLNAPPGRISSELIETLTRTNFIWRVASSPDHELLLTAGDKPDERLAEKIRSLIQSEKVKGETRIILQLGPPRGSLRLGQVCLALFADTLAKMLQAVGRKAKLCFIVNDNPHHLENLGRSLKTRYLKELGYCSLMPEGSILDGFLVFIAREMKDKIGHTLATEYSSKPFTAFAVDRIMEHWQAELESIGIENLQFLFESKIDQQKAPDVLVHIHYHDNAPVPWPEIAVEDFSLHFHKVSRGSRQIDINDPRGDVLTFSQVLKEIGAEGIREFALDHIALQ